MDSTNLVLTFHNLARDCELQANSMLDPGELLLSYGKGIPIGSAIGAAQAYKHCASLIEAGQEVPDA